jgi:AcrR family transcriptional regulator
VANVAEVTDAQPAGLRQRKKADTRRALSDAAVELAFEHGFEAVTREAIANVAGVSLRTFNNYFTGKYEALAYRLTERMRRSIEAFRARPADEPLWTSITLAVVGTMEEDMGELAAEDHVPDRQELAEIRKLLMLPEIRTAVPRDLLEDWVVAIAEKTGTDPERDMYPRLVTAVVRAVGDTAMEAYARSEPPVAVTELLRQGLAAVAAGLPEPTKGSSDD